VEIKGSFVGEIRKGREIGKTPADQKFIWQACQNCGVPRWVRIQNGNPASLKCKECADLALRKSSPIPYTGNPVLGEIRRGWEIGKSPKFGYIWAACSKCGVPRWVMLKKGEPESLICDSCSRLARRKVNLNTGAPQIGETRMGREIGRKPDSTGFIYRVCPDCGKLDWVQVNKGKPANLRCEECANLAKRKTSPIPYNGNPQLGEIRQGWEIGKSPELKYIWHACQDCNFERWVLCRDGKPTDLRCKKCAYSARRKVRTINTTPPVIGEIRMGWEIGKKSCIWNSFIWTTCLKCGVARWVQITKSGKLKNLLCPECAPLTNKGENNCNWAGGASFEPYTAEFNNRLKEQIRKRDNYTCQLCGKPQGKKKLAVHHINYIKEDCRPKNLISLCSGVKGEYHCHTLTNHDRPSWMAFFTDLMERRFPVVTESCVNSLNKEGENNVALD
jgi:hypothetical protein